MVACFEKRGPLNQIRGWCLGGERETLRAFFEKWETLQTKCGVGV